MSTAAVNEMSSEESSSRPRPFCPEALQCNNDTDRENLEDYIQILAIVVLCGRTHTEEL